VLLLGGSFTEDFHPAAVLGLQLGDLLVGVGLRGRDQHVRAYRLDQ